MTKYFLSLIFSLTLCLSLGHAAHSEILEQSFSDSDAKFKITAPSEHWKINPRGSDPGSERLTIRFESALNQFVPNVTVQVLPLLDPKTRLDDYWEGELKKIPEKVEVLEKKPITHLGHKGYELRLKFPAQNIVFYQWIFLAKGRSYVVTCTAKEEALPRVLADFNKILNSFEIL